MARNEITLRDQILLSLLVKVVEKRFSVTNIHKSNSFNSLHLIILGTLFSLNFASTKFRDFERFAKED